MKKIKMVEIYSGKDQVWKGWHNLILIDDKDKEFSKSIQGPIDPETSAEIKEALGL